MMLRMGMLLATLLWAASGNAGEPVPWTLQVEVRGAVIEGTPLAWSERQVLVLGRDGRLWDFKPSEAKNFRKMSSTFRPYSAAEVRDLVYRQLGRQFEVSGTSHYLVAHPAGERDLWADRFEDLYRSFVHYFSVRGFELAEPQFPLVAVVYSRREDFEQAAVRGGVRAGSGVIGFYSLATNRISLYDVGNGHGTAKDWRQNAATILHEATHQLAFNTGIQNRFAETPQWIAEGLATLFENPSVADSRSNGRLGDRINRQRWADFKREAESRLTPDTLAALVESDRPFRENALAAYAEAWAFTFYLVEIEPRNYAEYLRRVARRAPFRPYPASERLADFTAVFGDDFPLMHAHFVRFLKNL
ncbi:MAG: DUF1570 domain-containing protein [Pirellulales bacterium]